MCVKPVIHGHTPQSILQHEARRYEDLACFRIIVVEGVVVVVLVVAVVAILLLLLQLQVS